MESVNRIILVGHVAADPETIETKSGKTKVIFPIAIHRDYTSEGVKKEVIDFHRVIAWGKLGEICQRYLTKGQGVFVEGSILNRAYEVNGERKYMTEVKATEVNVLSWRHKGGVESLSIDALPGD
jgi:single-strand DNA-binding protein